MKWFELVRVSQGLCARCASNNKVIVSGLLAAVFPRMVMLTKRVKQPLCKWCQEYEVSEGELIRRYRYARKIGMPHKQAARFAADSRCWYGMVAVITSMQDDLGYGFYDASDLGEIFGPWDTIPQTVSEARRCGYSEIAYDYPLCGSKW